MRTTITQTQRALFSALLLVAMLAAPHARSAEGDGMVLDPHGKLVKSSTTAVRGVPAAGADAASDSWLRSAGTFLVLLGLAGGALVLMRRQQALVRAKGAAQNQLELIERMPLGPRRELLLVRAGGRVLVLAALQQDLKLISTLPAGTIPAQAGAQDFLALLNRQAAIQEAAPVKTSARNPLDEVDWPAAAVRS